jgi:mono/diheme cytochrome c family protein
MLKRTVLVAFFTATALAFGSAQKPTLHLKAGKTPANDGKQMYVSYCAPCHGIDGKGQGSVASALVAKPTDLTELSKNNNGKFPDIHVLAVIQLGVKVQAHGVKDMPVWGTVLGNLDTLGTSQDMQLLRASNLEKYVKSLQAN